MLFISCCFLEWRLRVFPGAGLSVARTASGTGMAGSHEKLATPVACLHSRQVKTIGVRSVDGYDRVRTLPQSTSLRGLGEKKRTQKNQIK